MSLLPRLSACIPGRSSSLLVLLAFLLLLTPQTLDGENSAHPGTHPGGTERTICTRAVSLERERALPEPSSNLVSSTADSDVSVVRELRCICMTITPKVSPTMITNLEVIARGQQCPNVQVIASLKNGKEVCLDPDAPLIKKIIKKMLDRNKKTN